ncbi:MAG: hypothetical protein U0Q16_33545 [Bryobacteraceae bacterium]
MSTAPAPAMRSSGVPAFAQRPQGVSILAWGSLIYGLWKLFVPILLLGVGGALLNWGGFVASAAGVIAVIVAVLKLVTPIFYLIFSFGAFRMKSWAWPMGIIAPLFGVLGGMWSFLHGDSLRHLFLTSLVPVLILGYLFTPAVKRAFGRP